MLFIIAGSSLASLGLVTAIGTSLSKFSILTGSFTTDTISSSLSSSIGVLTFIGDTSFSSSSLIPSAS